MYDEMKHWFGQDGEIDIDFAVRMGMTTPTNVVMMCLGFIDSPWRGWVL